MITIANDVNIVLFDEIKTDTQKEKTLYNVLNYKIKHNKIPLLDENDLLIENYKEFNDKYKEFHDVCNEYYYNESDGHVFDTIENVENSY